MIVRISVIQLFLLKVQSPSRFLCCSKDVCYDVSVLTHSIIKRASVEFISLLLGNTKHFTLEREASQMDRAGAIDLKGWGVYASFILHLCYSHTNPIRQDPVGQLTWVLYLVIPTSPCPFPRCGSFKETIHLQQGASSSVLQQWLPMQ